MTAASAVPPPPPSRQPSGVIGPADRIPAMRLMPVDVPVPPRLEADARVYRLTGRPTGHEPGAWSLGRDVVGHLEPRLGVPVTLIVRENPIDLRRCPDVWAYELLFPTAAGPTRVGVVRSVVITHYEVWDPRLGDTGPAWGITLDGDIVPHAPRGVDAIAAQLAQLVWRAVADLDALASPARGDSREGPRHWPGPSSTNQRRTA